MMKTCDTFDDEHFGGFLELHHHRSERAGSHFMMSSCNAFDDELFGGSQPGIISHDHDMDHEFAETKRSITTPPTSLEDIFYLDDVDSKSPSVDEGALSAAISLSNRLEEEALSPDNASEYHPPEVQPNKTTHNSSSMELESCDLIEELFSITP